MPEPLELFTSLDDPQQLSPTTPELRASVHARARQIRRNRMTAFAVPVSLVAAGIVALLVIVGLPSNKASVEPVAPTPTSSNGPTPSHRASSPALTPLGTTGTRAEVPWAQIGPGWFLVTSATAGKGELYLTNPDGGRYAIAELAIQHGQVAPELVDWSGDGHRALLTFSSGSGTLLTEVDLQTGAVRSQQIPQTLPQVVYSRPTGTKILIADDQGITAKRLYRLTWGKAPVVASAVAPGGYVTQNAVLYNATGTEIVMGAGSGLNVIGNDGRLIRTLPVPGACSPVKWWDQTRILATCIDTSLDPQRLWLVPVAGGAAAALTPQRSGSSSADLGDVDAWALPNGRLYLHAFGACGAEHLMAQAADGSVTVLDAPEGLGNNLVPQTAVGSRIAVLVQSECGTNVSLLWLDPLTGNGQPFTNGNIGTVLPWDATQT